MLKLPLRKSVVPIKTFRIVDSWRFFDASTALLTESQKPLRLSSLSFSKISPLVPKPIPTCS